MEEQVKVLRAFQYAPDGNTVATVEAGEIVTGRAAFLALDLGCGELVAGGASNASRAPSAPSSALDHASSPETTEPAPAKRAARPRP